MKKIPDITYKLKLLAFFPLKINHLLHLIFQLKLLFAFLLFFFKFKILL